MNIALQVLIIGGYGEFGGRLARLLLRDSQKVIVAGRNIDKARLFCNAHGGKPLKLDIETDLDIIDTLEVDVVVDAAGPYQSYGDDESSYRVARKALECHAHYLDLSDDGAYSRAIANLDALAKKQKRFALSGASSTPALSGAVVAAMQHKLHSIEKIETSILPGSRAPQGQSVMLAILNQVGNPTPIWRESTWQEHIGWSAPLHKRIGAKISRKANLVNTADTLLFPDHFQAKSVLFRAGLAMPIMHMSLQWLGRFRSLGWLPNLTKFVAPLRWLANRLTPFGSDYGGMLVEVTGVHRNTQFADETQYCQSEQFDTSPPDTSSPSPGLVSINWHLAAQPGQGPFVPAVPIRAILRNIDCIANGARACIGELSLEQYVHAMDDLGIETGSHTEPFNYLFSDTLGDHWSALPKTLRNTHKVVDIKTLHGYAKITRGTSWLTQLIATVFRFPSSTNHISVQVTKIRHADSETWVRNFNGQQFKSTLRKHAKPPKHSNEPLIEEQFGLLKFLIKLRLDSDGLHFPVIRGSCLGIPIPKVILPISNAREFEKNGTMCFRVELLAPFKLGLIVRYEGWLK